MKKKMQPENTNADVIIQFESPAFVWPEFR